MKVNEESKIKKRANARLYIIVTCGLAPVPSISRR